MILSQSFWRYFLVIATPILMIFAMWILSKSVWFSSYPRELSFGITLDLLLTMPFLHFLNIRKKKIPQLTIISVFVIGMFAAYVILPENQQFLLIYIKTYFIPILELGMLFFLVYKGILIFKSFKLVTNSNLDFYDAIKISIQEVFSKKISSFLAAEITVIYYAFFSWNRREVKSNEFTSYKENGIKMILYALILIIFIETFTLHSFLEKWSFIAAWILSFLSIYTALQIFSLIKSISKRPIYIDEINQKLVLRFGFLGFAEIPLSEIHNLEIHNKDLPDDKSILPFSPLGTIGGHNIILHLKNKIHFEGFYGMKKTSNKLAIFVDDKIRFVNLLEKKILNI